MAKNLTLTVDDELLDQARVLAAMERTSVNAMVRDFLQKRIRDAREHDEAREELLRLARESDADFGPGPFVREEAYTGAKRFDRWR